MGSGHWILNHLPNADSGEYPKYDALVLNKSYPDFILYSKAYPELIIVVEAKADINIGSYPGWLSFGTADFCGAKIRAAVGGL